MWNEAMKHTQWSALAGVLVFCAAAALAACGTTAGEQNQAATTKPTPTPILHRISTGPQGRIAYVRTLDRGAGDYDLYTMDADGSNMRELTSFPGLETEPDWSPDGQMIAFVSTQESKDPNDCTSGYVEFRCAFQIYRINADGSGLMRLTAGERYERSPVWSPDGTQILYASREVGANDGYLYLMQADGSNAHPITSGADDYTSPTWSPDGKRIAFVRNNHDEMQVWVSDADGGNAQQITKGRDYSFNPVWSPDGSKIAFLVVARRDKAAHIVLVHPDGTDPQVVPNAEVNTGYPPSWSPDGKRLIYVRFNPGRYDLSVTDLDGSHIEELTHSDAFYSAPSWSAATP
ncbi:hypothetical protein F8S13_18550 [Chloroflexia bacterium SDU3-3]|nr:hypothetical protein F8S13_18550 [Chloroflexia bacterium SDU3-3]